MTSSGGPLVVSVTEVQFACFGSSPLFCSAATSIRRVSYGFSRRAGPAALPDTLSARQLKRKAASTGLLVLFRMKSCGRSVVPGGNAKAGSGFESANIGARKVHTAVFAKSLCSSLAFGSWSNIFKMAENGAVSSNRKCTVSREPACAVVETLMPPCEPLSPAATINLRTEYRMVS